MTLSIWNHRSKLHHTRMKIQEGSLTVGFIGGSITDASRVIIGLSPSLPGSRSNIQNCV